MLEAETKSSETLVNLTSVIDVVYIIERELINF